MRTIDKPTQSEEEDQHHRLAEKQGASMVSNTDIYYRNQNKKGHIQSQSSITIAILMILLIVTVAVFTFRYMDLREKSFEKPLVKDETQIYSSGIADSTYKTQNQYDLNGPDGQNPMSDQNLQMDSYMSENGQSYQKNVQDENQQQVIQDLDQTEQNFQQPKTESQQLLDEMTDANNQQIDENEDGIGGEDMNGAGSVEEAELLDSKAEEKSDQEKSYDDEEYELHPKARAFDTEEQVAQQQQPNNQQSVIQHNDNEKINTIDTELHLEREESLVGQNVEKNLKSEDDDAFEHEQLEQQQEKQKLEMQSMGEQVPTQGSGLQVINGDSHASSTTTSGIEVEVSQSQQETTQQVTVQMLSQQQQQQSQAQTQTPQPQPQPQPSLSTVQPNSQQLIIPTPQPTPQPSTLIPQPTQAPTTPQQPPTLQPTGTPPKTSSLVFTEQDMYDPIIRVKDKMQERFNTKFQDLIYIKPGTNITEDQYYKARERMGLWKYFNPSTGKLAILDQVSYEPSVVASAQAMQEEIGKMQKVILEEQLEYEKKYQVSQYGEIPFCIIIPSYKNQDKYFRNLNSILQQDYKNYHIIYIDDASKDGTAEKVRGYIEKYQVPEERLKFIENKENKKALPNIDYAARKLCKSGEIMAIIDGDDYLIGTQTFKLINAQYQREKLLALYTNHLRVHEPIYLKVGTCIDYPERVKKARSYRRFSIFPASHLRTFFVDLYWRINLRDLKDYRGEYFTAANDFAIMMPILEMAGERSQYLSELTYVYDAGTGFNNFQTKADTQAKNFKITKRRHKYPKIVHDLEFEKTLKAKGLMPVAK